MPFRHRILTLSALAAFLGAAQAQIIKFPPETPIQQSPYTESRTADRYPKLVWGWSLWASTYEVDIAGSLDYATHAVLSSVGRTDTTWPLEPLGADRFEGNATYFWRVRARNNNGVSEWSPSWTWTTPPTPYFKLKYPAQGDTLASPYGALYWTRYQQPDVAVTNGRYTWEINTDSTFAKYLTGDTTSDTTDQGLNLVTSWLKHDTKYHWRVKFEFSDYGDARNRTTGWIYGSFRTAPLPPLPPAILAPKSGLAFTVPTFIWYKAERATGYTLEISSSEAFAKPDTVHKGIKDTTFSGIRLKPGDYWWRVIAVNAGGESGASFAGRFTVPKPPAAPILGAPKDGAILGNGDVTLAWTPSEGAYSCQLRLGVDTLFRKPAKDTLVPNTTSWIALAGLAEGTWHWGVECNSLGGPGPMARARFEVKTPTGTVLAHPLPLRRGVQSLALPGVRSGSHLISGKRAEKREK